MRRQPHGRVRDEYACDHHEIHAAAEITPMKDLNVGHREKICPEIRFGGMLILPRSMI
jgi:hypothetical protein